MRRYSASRDGVALFILMLPIVLPVVVLLDSIGFFPGGSVSRLLSLTLFTSTLSTLLVIGLFAAVDRFDEIRRFALVMSARFIPESTNAPR